jgi:hypothetical protein
VCVSVCVCALAHVDREQHVHVREQHAQSTTPKFCVYIGRRFTGLKPVKR